MKRFFSNTIWYRKGLILLILAAAAVIISVYGYFEKNTEHKPYHIVMIPKVIDDQNDFWKALIEGAQVASHEYQINLEIVAPDAENHHDRQSELLLKAAEEKPDAVLLTPTSYTEVSSAAKAVKDAGIPLILVDSTLDGDFADAIIQTDNILAGEKMAGCLAGILPEDARIGIIAHVQGSSTAMERENGFRKGLGQYEQNIVDVVFSNSDYDRAYKVTKEMLERHPDINVLVGLNEYSAVGAARAVIDEGLSDRIQMIGFDSSEEEIRLLETGIFKGIVVQKPFNMGYLGVEMAVRLLNGETVERQMDSGSKAITKDEMYTEENQKLLFLFREND